MFRVLKLYNTLSCLTYYPDIFVSSCIHKDVLKAFLVIKSFRKM